MRMGRTFKSPEQKTLNAQKETVPEDDNESPYANGISSLCTDHVRRRAEAAAGRKRIQYAVKEIELGKRQAEIEAELELLNLRRDAAKLVSHIGVYNEMHLSNFR